MADDIARNARDYVLLAESKKSEALSLAQDTAAKIESQQVTLFEVVQSLGEYINHNDPAIRAKATDYFSHVINSLTPDSLSARHAQVVCTFLCSRMEDGGAISGIAALQRQKVFNGEMAVMTFRAMVASSAELRQRPQDQRFRAVEVLHRLMATHRLALKGLGVESATGVIELVSGEKDPRNLMVIFSTLEVIIAEWDVAPLAETLFDSVFCYFPITFRPPPGNPYGITAADLKARLRSCIAASPYLAHYAFPQLIDKLDSSSMNVKPGVLIKHQRDVLLALRACVTSYDPVTLSGYTVFLWDSLKFEIFNAQDEELSEDTLAVLCSFANRLGDDKSEEGGSTLSSGFLNLICKECIDRLKEPQQKQAKSAGHILKELAGTSPDSFSAVVQATFPQITSQYPEAGSDEERLAILEPMSGIVQSAPAKFRRSPKASTVGNPLGQFKEAILEICTIALSSPQQDSAALQVVVLTILSSLCELSNVLVPGQVKTAVFLFNKIILRQRGGIEATLKDAAIQGLRTVSRFHPDLVVEETFPALISRISSPDASLDFESYCENLECLASISVGGKFCGTLIRRLFGVLGDAVTQGGPTENVTAILSTINYVLVKEARSDSLGIAEYYRKLLELIAKVTDGATGKGPPTPLNQPGAILSLGRLARTIVREVDEEVQREIAKYIYTLFTDQPIFITQSPYTEVPELRRQTIVLSTYFLAAVRTEFIPLEVDHECEILLGNLAERSAQETSASIQQGLLQQITIMVNKFLAVDKLDVAASMLLQVCSESVRADRRFANSVPAIFSIARALLWRFHDVEHILERLLLLLDDPENSMEAARGFELLFAPDEVVSEENGANIHPFAQQRIFGVCLPTIATKVRGANPCKANYLLVLAGMLKHVETSLLLGDMETILPPSLQILDLDSKEAKASTIRMLRIMIQQNPAVLEEHAVSLVNRLLKIAADGQANEVGLRKDALTLLGLLPSKMKETTVLPLRHSTTRKLLAALDDRKRQVRKAAVDCRTAWLGLENADDEA